MVKVVTKVYSMNPCLNLHTLIPLPASSLQIALFLLSASLSLTRLNSLPITLRLGELSVFHDILSLSSLYRALYYVLC